LLSGSALAYNISGDISQPAAQETEKQIRYLFSLGAPNTATSAPFGRKKECHFVGKNQSS